MGQENMPRVRLALFDCDGTLIDSQHAIIAAMLAAWQGQGLGEPPESEMIRRVVGLPLDVVVARLLPSGSMASQEALVERYKREFQRQRQSGQFREPLYPGLREVLETLRSDGVQLGIATGKSMRGLVAALEHNDLGSFFVTLQTADTGPGKPDPAMVLRALAESGAKAVDTVMIGDTVFDIEMAVRAGVRAIGVAWGYHKAHELYAAGARIVVFTTFDLLLAIKSML
ncbi:MAG: HAD-IA family hydrolase [Rhodospirillaceae bacterium]